MSRFVLSLSALLVLFSPLVLAEGNEEYFRLMTGAKWGGKCSWKAEMKRQEYTRQLMDTSDTYEKLQLTNNWKEYVLKSGENFCSALLLNVCDKETKRCVCGDPGKRGSSTVEDYPEQYALEIVGNQTKCRWSPGMGCTSDKSFKSDEEVGKYVDSTCAQGTTCLSVASGETCSMFTTFLYRLTHRKDSVQTFIDDSFSGKICACQKSNDAVQVEESQEPTEKNDEENKSPLKRFISVRSKRAAGINGGSSLEGVMFHGLESSVY